MRSTALVLIMRRLYLRNFLLDMQHLLAVKDNAYIYSCKNHEQNYGRFHTLASPNSFYGVET